LIYFLLGLPVFRHF